MNLLGILAKPEKSIFAVHSPPLHSTPLFCTVLHCTVIDRCSHVPNRKGGGVSSESGGRAPVKCNMEKRSEQRVDPNVRTESGGRLLPIPSHLIPSHLSLYAFFCTEHISPHLHPIFIHHHSPNSQTLHLSPAEQRRQT